MSLFNSYSDPHRYINSHMVDDDVTDDIKEQMFAELPEGHKQFILDQQKKEDAALDAYFRSLMNGGNRFEAEQAYHNAHRSYHRELFKDFSTVSI